MAERIPAIEMIPAIRQEIAQVEAESGSPEASGRRAALWRAQQHAANPERTVEELRRFCLESLRPRRFVEEGDYLRGYRAGFQALLKRIRELETTHRQR